MVGRTRVKPVLAANVSIMGAATDVDDDTEKTDNLQSEKCSMVRQRERYCLHEADDGCDFDGREKKLGLTVALDAHEVDTSYDEKKNSHENGRAEGLVPVLNSQGTRDELQRHCKQPLQGIAADSEVRQAW